MARDGRRRYARASGPRRGAGLAFFDRASEEVKPPI